LTMPVETTPLKPELRGILIEAGNKLFIKFGKGEYGWFTLFRFLFGGYCALMGIAMVFSGESMKMQLSLFAWAAFYISMSNVWYDVTDFYKENEVKG
jgi:hypothetical protein